MHRDTFDRPHVIKLPIDSANVSPARPKRDKMEKLSVLMPVYNERWTLREIVRGCSRRRLALEIELIAVDDGSTDGSGTCCKSWRRPTTASRSCRHDATAARERPFAPPSRT